MFGIDGLRGKLLAVLLAFAILPMAFIGILSLGEMNRASSDIENNITNLSTSLNRSALAAGSHEADQVQLAEAKAGKSLEEIAKAAGYEVKKSKAVNRGEGAAATPGSLEERVFSVKPGEVTLAPVPDTVVNCPFL